MEFSNALASLAVADLAAASAWYERLLGPGGHPMPELYEWQFAGGGGLQVYSLPERSGRGSCTIIVEDIDEVVAHLEQLDLGVGLEPVHGDSVDTVMIRDPEGNSIAFAAPHADGLAR